jgi:hypothetical protein
MAKTLAHPKSGKKCAFCKRWNGDANLEFKSPSAGYLITVGVFGKCMASASGINQPSTGGTSCNKYEPSVEASRLL